jgi:nucleotide-binding universal stress UspA family protein
VQAEARAALVELLRSSMERFGASGEARVVEGPPVAAVLHAVEELNPELLVVGTHGRTGLQRLALGSVAERLVSHAPCSVLVVRQTA